MPGTDPRGPLVEGPHRASIIAFGDFSCTPAPTKERTAEVPHLAPGGLNLFYFPGKKCEAFGLVFCISRNNQSFNFSGNIVKLTKIRKLSMKRGQQQKNWWFPIKTRRKNGICHIPIYNNIKYAPFIRSPTHPSFHRPTHSCDKAVSALEKKSQTK